MVEKSEIGQSFRCVWLASFPSDNYFLKCQGNESDQRQLQLSDAKELIYIYFFFVTPIVLYVKQMGG